MSVTDTNENKVLNWNTKIQIAMKSVSDNIKKVKNPKFQNIPKQEDCNDSRTRSIFRT